MRNQVLYSIIGLAALFLVNACQKPVVNPPVLKIPTTEFPANADGDVVTVNYTLTNGVEGSEISVEPVEKYDWVEDITVGTSAIEVTVARNETTEPRTAEFTVSYPGVTKDLSFSITQAAGEAPAVEATVTIEPTSAEVSAEGVEDEMFIYTISPEGLSWEDLTCAVSYAEGDAGGWVTCEEADLNADGAISYSVEPNEGEARTAYVTVSYPNAEDVVFTINQAAAGASSEYDYEYTVAAFMGMLLEEAETYDNYQIYMSSLPLTAEGGFDLTAVNYTFDVYANAGTKGAFPAGEYVLGEGSTPNTIGKEWSNYTTDGYETSITFTEGTMAVSIDGENYDFDITLTDAEGKTHHLTYTGPAFETGGDEPSDEVNYDFEYSNLSFYEGEGENGEDNFFLVLSDMPFDADGYEADGSTIANFDIYATAGTNEVLPAGTYRFDDYNYVEMTFSVGSYIRTPDKEYIYFSDGTIEVTKNGDDYVFEATLTGSKDGKTYKVSYTGPIGDAGDEPDPSEVTFEISVDNVTYEGYTYSIIPSDKDMTYIHLGTPKAVLVQYGAMTEDGDLNEYVLHDDVISLFLSDYRDMLVHTGDLTAATPLFPASSGDDVVVLCYGTDAGDNRTTPVTTYEFTMPAMPAVITLDEETIEAGADGYAGGVYYGLGGDYDPEGTVTAVVEAGVDWVHATVDPDQKYIAVSVDPNGKPAARTATITVSHPSVDEPAVLTVYQEAGELVLTENPAWTVSYYGKTIYNGQVTDAATVVSTSNDTYLQPIFISKADYESRGLKAIIEEDYAIWEYTLEYYGGMYTWEDFLYDAPGTYIVEYLEDTSTEYYALVYGVDTDGVLTGYYALSDSFYPEEITVDEGYNKWLGTWRIEDASGVGYDVVISEAVAGATYAMTGWQSDDVVKSFGQEYPVSLTYDSESQSLMFAAGQLGTYDAGYVYFLGTSEDGRLVSGNYNIASASFEDGGNTAKVTPMEVALSDGSTFVPYRMQVLDLYYGQQWYIVSDQATVPVFPLTMEKVSSSSSSAAPAAFSATLKRASADGVKKLGKIEPAKIVKFSTKK